MSQTYVAIDLETTGLSADTDEIIEVGAVKFCQDGVVDTFATFVNPGRHIPYRISLLTGISDQNVADAPTFAQIADKLRDFLGDHPIVGQNVSFDLGFLARRDIRPAGPVYDTVELSVLLMPGLPEYGLLALTRHLDIPFPVRHRALADATATKEVFLALLRRAAALPPEVLAEAAHTGGSEWSPGRLLQQAIARQPAATGPLATWRPAALEESEPLRAKASREPVTPVEVKAVLRQAAGRSDLWSDYEERPQQLAMAAAVADALSASEHLLAQAGTGVGKSLAYLVPAAIYALRNGVRTIISTDTISLQDQLMQKDIPLVVRLLAAHYGPALADNLRVTQLKGRQNYLCLRRWDALRRGGSRTPEEGRLAARLLLWLTETKTGDRAELRLSPQEQAVWSHLSAQNEDCLSGPCPYVRDGTCFLLRAKQRAEACHLVVVNHALLLSDLSVGGRVLPPYDHLIIDEAHNLEERATQQFAFEAGPSDVADLLDRVYQPQAAGGAGIAGFLRAALRGAAAPLATTAHLLTIAEALLAAVERGHRRTTEFFEAVVHFLATRGSGNGDYEWRLLLTPGLRASPEWAAVELAWDNLGLCLGEIAADLGRLRDELSDAEGLSMAQHEDLQATVAACLQNVRGMMEGVGDVVRGHDGQRICWLAGRPDRGQARVAAAPLEVAPILREHLFSKKDSVILTSATLAQEGSFQYSRKRLGVDEGEELILGSPFDFRRSTLLLLPTDMPVPSNARYLPALASAVVELCRASRGRALVLLTSYAALRSLYEAVRQPLEKEGLDVLAQGIDGAPQQLLDALRRQRRTVLLGTSSFWEGADVVGEALSLLIIAKLPFSVPDDPVFAARAALLEEPFRQYALPQAVLRFQQGFGRLIRHRDDRGVVAVLDRRLISRSYGGALLNALPECTVRQAPLADLPPLVAEWLNREKE